MRRALAIALLFAFFAPAAAPSLAALTADPEANLPPCCRSHGAHHCAMMHWMLAHRGTDTPAFSQAPCPLYPTAVVVPEQATFVGAAPPRLSGHFFTSKPFLVAEARPAHLFVASAHKTRGPPGALA